MERTNVIKVIGYTPILIELCIPYFFTILQKFFAVELFSHNLICINELYDGKYYIESLYLIDSFQITDRGLELYYENKKYYLLLQPLTTPTLPQGLHPVATTNIKQSTLVLKSSALLSGLLSTPDPHPVRCVPL
jgi:hypothetical protein